MKSNCHNSCCIGSGLQYLKTYSIYHLDKGLDKLVAKGAVILDVRTGG